MGKDTTMSSALYTRYWNNYHTQIGEEFSSRSLIIEFCSKFWDEVVYISSRGIEFNQICIGPEIIFYLEAFQIDKRVKKLPVPVGSTFAYFNGIPIFVSADVDSKSLLCGYSDSPKEQFNSDTFNPVAAIRTFGTLGG